MSKAWVNCPIIQNVYNYYDSYTCCGTYRLTAHNGPSSLLIGLVSNHQLCHTKLIGVMLISGATGQPLAYIHAKHTGGTVSSYFEVRSLVRKLVLIHYSVMYVDLELSETYKITSWRTPHT